MTMQQVDHKGGDPGAILDRCRNSFREARLRGRPARPAAANMRAMFGHHKRLRLGKIKHLPGNVAGRHGGRQCRTAARAHRGIVINHRVRYFHLTQGLARMPLLAATGPARRLAQALDPWWLFQPIARWRLAAVGTVQSEPALEFGDACPERRDLGRLRCYQRNQLFPRWLRPRIKFRIHRILESKPDSAVQKNLQSTGLPTPAHLGSYHVWLSVGDNIADFSVGDWRNLNCREVSYPGAPVL